MSTFSWKQKKGELTQAYIPGPCPSAVRNLLATKELSWHCRRKTRGHEETFKDIEALLLALSPAINTLGVPLFED